MIVLTKITLKNACQHENLVITPGSGLVAILGANGSGKSNVLRLVVYALTGTVDGTWGTQSDLQCDIATVPGFVELELADAQHTYCVRRYFLDAVKYPDELRIDSTEVILRRAKVNAKLTELFGVPLSMLATLVWAKQEMFDWLLCSPAAAIKAFFTELFNAEVLNNVRTKLQSAISSIYIPPDMSARISAITEELEQLDAGIAAADADLESCNKQLKESQELLDSCEQTAASSMPYDMWKTTIDSARRNLEQLERTKDQAMDDSTALEYQLEQQKKRVDLYTGQMQRIEAWQKVQAALDDSCTAALNEAAQKLQSIAADISGMDSGECPLCHTDLGSADRVAAVLCAKYQVSDIMEYAELLANRQQCIQNELDRIRYRIQRLDQIYTAVQTKHRLATRAAAKTQATLESTDRQHKLIQAATAAYASAASEVARLESMPYMSKEDTDTLMQLRTIVAEERKHAAKLENQWYADSARRAALAGKLTEVQAQQVQHAKATLIHGVLTELRECFGPKRAQALYIAKRMEALNELLARRMQHTDLPFELFFDTEAYVFRYRTADGYTHPTGHLSGAQKKICAMILQVCLYEHAQPNLDLLLLDEVDAALDPANRIMLAGLLALLRRDSGGCIMVATRERETIEQCTTVIDITEKGDTCM